MDSPQEEENKNEYSEHIAFLCDRVEKVTNATYRVTDLLPDKEPLKWLVREKSVAVFSGLVSSSGKTFLFKNSSLEEAEDLIGQIIVLLSPFVSEKSVSGMNFKILKQEYSAIKEKIGKEKSSRDFYKVFWGEEKKTLSPPSGSGQVSNGHPIGHHNKEMSDKVFNGQREIGKNKKQISIKSKDSKKNINKDTSPADARKEKIFNIIKDKGQTTVGELSAIFTEYSEKTLQRDLAEMVRKGLLSKQGDKRWRTYLLKHEA